MSEKPYFWCGPGLLRTLSGDLEPGQRIPADTTPEQVQKWLASERIQAGPIAVPTPAGEPAQPKLWWAFTPEQLAGKTLAQLNMMVADQALRAGMTPPEPFSSLEDAVEFLMQDVLHGGS